MKNTILNCQYDSTEQAIHGVFSEYLDILDPVITFDKLMEGIDISSYIDCSRKNYVGRIGYNPINMFKTVLFEFMDKGYISTRELEDECKVNIDSINLEILLVSIGFNLKKFHLKKLHNYRSCLIKFKLPLPHKVISYGVGAVLKVIRFYHFFMQS